MRYLLLMLLATVLVCGGCSHVPASNNGEDTDSDSDTDTDTDTGSDSDSASDIDTETEEEGCGAPTGITDWGDPCHTNADCPPETECMIFNSMDDTQGFCAAKCCNLETADPTHCTDVAGGQEGCHIWPVECYLEYSPFYCIIFCNTVADCPLGTDCVETGSGSKICYGYAPATDAGVDAA